MKNLLQTVFAMLAVCGSALLAGCATDAQSVALFDFGPTGIAQRSDALPALPTISVAAVDAPNALDNPLMYYRLNYANNQQRRPYANSRWTMPPAQLLTERLKTRMAQAGSAVLPESHGALNVPVLRVELDEFTQLFDSPDQSVAHVVLRAALFDGRKLMTQKTFARQVPAPSPDAGGGARALAAASDAIITEMMGWLATQPLASK